jgi:hypothetical protein
MAKMLPYLIHHQDCDGIGLQATQVLLRQKQQPEMLWQAYQCHFLRNSKKVEAIHMARWILSKNPEPYIWIICVWALQRLQHHYEAEKVLFEALNHPLYKSVAIQLIRQERQLQLVSLLKETYCS